MIQDNFTPGYEVKRRSTINEGGIAKDTFTTVATISGKMRPLSGSEIFQNEKNNYQTTHRFYCDVTEIHSNDLIYKDGKYFEVKMIINPMEMNQFLQVDCEFKESI